MSENFTPISSRGEEDFQNQENDGNRPLLMGILNITPDSFYDESRYSADEAVKKAM